MAERDLAGEVALVTGGGRGIGASIAELLAARGAKVALCARTVEEVEAKAAEIRANGGQAIAVHLDVLDAAAVEHAVAKVVERLDGISILVNNAGTAVVKPFLELSIDEWDQVANTNLRGTFLCTRFVLPHMLRAGRGCIVNVASLWAVRGAPWRSPYVASKHGVMGLTRALAQEFKDQGIRVNAVNPGAVETKMRATGAGALKHDSWLSPLQVAEAVAFLCSSAAGAISGVGLNVLGTGEHVGL